MGIWCRPEPMNDLFGVQCNATSVLEAAMLRMCARVVLPCRHLSPLAGLLPWRWSTVPILNLAGALSLQPTAVLCTHDTRLMAAAPSDRKTPLPLANRNPLTGDTILQSQAVETQRPGNLYIIQLCPPNEQASALSHP